MKTTLNLLILCYLFCIAMPSVASTLNVSTLETEELRTREIGLLPPSNLPDAMLYYDFNDVPSGNVIIDKSPNGYDGVAANCVWSSAGKFHGGAMSFGSNVANINVGTTPNFPTWESYSVSVWFLHDGGDYFNYNFNSKIIDKTSYWHDWHLHVFSPGGNFYPGNIGWTLYENSQSAGAHIMDKNYGDGNWHHIVAIRAGSHGELWVDGVCKQTIENMISVYSDSAMCVGNSYSGDSNQRTPWSGLLDEVMIFDRALSSNEVSSLFTDGVLSHPTNDVPTAITVTTNVVIQGALTVTGKVSFAGGVIYCKPLGDLSSGPYTNSTVVLP